jgi:hypothetical protein
VVVPIGPTRPLYRCDEYDDGALARVYCHKPVAFIVSIILTVSHLRASTQSRVLSFFPRMSLSRPRAKLPEVTSLVYLNEIVV